MTAWSKDLGSVDTPMRAVGLRAFTADSKSGTCSSCRRRSKSHHNNIGSGAVGEVKCGCDVHTFVLGGGVLYLRATTVFVPVKALLHGVNSRGVNTTALKVVDIWELDKSDTI